MTARDLLLYGYYNVLLSNVPAVLAKKGLSDITAAMWEVSTRAVAERMPGSSGAVQTGEAGQMAYALASSFGDGLRLAARGIATGEHQFQGGYSMDAIGSNRVNTLAAGAPEALTSDQPVRAAADFLRCFLPTRWIGAADDFAKFMNYRMELRALAFRDAKSKGLSDDDLQRQITQTLAAPPADIHQQAVSAAIRTTFQDPLTGFPKHLSDAFNSLNLPILGTEISIPIGRIIAPFIKVPANLAAWTYRNSPVAAILRTGGVQSDMAAGGAARDLQIARMTLGSGLAMATASAALGGLVTGNGPSDPGLRRAWIAAGNQPYSLYINGEWYNYNKVDPIGMTLGAIADTYDIMRFAPDHERANLAVSLAFGLGKNLMSKTYTQSVANLIDAFNSPEKGASKYVDQFLQGLFGPSAAVGLERAVDPWLRAHYSLLDGIQARLPMVANGLPVDRTIWGDPIAKAQGFLPGLSGTGFARAVSPITFAPPDYAQPIDKWIWDNRTEFKSEDRDTLTITKPSEYQTFTSGQVSVPFKLSPAQLDRFIELAGNGFKDPSTGLGAKDTLNSLVTGTHPDAQQQREWDNAPPAMQAFIVQKNISEFRNSARQKLLFDDQELADNVRLALQAQYDRMTGSVSRALQHSQ